MILTENETVRQIFRTVARGEGRSRVWGGGPPLTLEGKRTIDGFREKGS